MRLMKKLLALVFALVAMGQIYADMVPDVWIIGSDNQPYFRKGIAKDVPQGFDWEKAEMPAGEKAQFVSVGPNGQVWVIGAAIPSRAPDGPLYYRVGVTPVTPKGTSWEKISGFAICVAVSNNFVIHTNRLGEIYASSAITDANFKAATWKKVDGTIKLISINKDDIVWGIQEPVGNKKIYVWDKPFAEADFNSVPWASHWKPVEGGLSQLSVGPDLDGQRLVWGVSDTYIFYRVGVTTVVPWGRVAWNRVAGGLTSLSVAPYPVKIGGVDKGMVWGVGSSGNIFYKNDVVAGGDGGAWKGLDGLAKQISVGGIAEFDKAVSAPTPAVPAPAVPAVPAVPAPAVPVQSVMVIDFGSDSSKNIEMISNVNKGTDIVNKIHNVLTLLDKAKDKTFDASIQDTFAMTLVNTSGQAKNILASMLQVLQTAQKTSLLSSGQQAYVTQMMIPSYIVKADVLPASSQPTTPMTAASVLDAITAINNDSNLASKIQGAVNLMAKAAGQSFDGATQDNFGMFLVNLSSSVQVILPLIQQVLKIAAQTPLLNAMQQAYVTNTMIPLFTSKPDTSAADKAAADKAAADAAAAQAAADKAAADKAAADKAAADKAASDAAAAQAAAQAAAIKAAAAQAAALKVATPVVKKAVVKKAVVKKPVAKKTVKKVIRKKVVKKKAAMPAVKR
ncbi:MAG: tectonin domain-containing protein [bacterium]